MSRHTHLHLNVKKSMPKDDITRDLEHAFGLKADTIGLCELETAWHHTEFHRLCRETGYTGFLPPLGHGGSALGIAVRTSYGNLLQPRSVFAAPGRSHVSPSRYINRVRVQRHIDKRMVSIAEHHAYSSGWTGVHSLDAFRRSRWYVGMAVVCLVERRATKHNDVVIGGGDLNRPPWAFRNNRPLPQLLSRRGMRSAGYAHTDHTHGSVTFCYVWYLSARHLVDVVVEHTRTPSFASDHDGILTTLEWPDTPATA
jgi:endonuclease/exonuclease/phosphatase family metal-dependent hydrolase